MRTRKVQNNHCWKPKQEKFEKGRKNKERVGGRLKRFVVIVLDLTAETWEEEIFS